MKNYFTQQKQLSYILKTVVLISSVLGTFLSAYAGRHSFMGGYSVFMYFTIQSNLLMAVLSAVGIYYLLKDRTGTVWPVIKFVGTVSITLTGMVFCFVLAPTMGPSAWNLQNILTHVVVPIAAVMDFFVVGQSFSIRYRQVFYVILPPLLYAIYAGIGYVRGWHFSENANYPYFFLNWGSPAGAFGVTNELPYIGCMWWILLLLLFLIAVGLLYLWIVTSLRKRMRNGS